VPKRSRFGSEHIHREILDNFGGTPKCFYTTERQRYTMSLLLDGANEKASNCLPENLHRRYDVGIRQCNRPRPFPLFGTGCSEFNRGVIMMVGCCSGHLHCLVRSHAKYFDWAMEIHSNHVHVKCVVHWHDVCLCELCEKTGNRSPPHAINLGTPIHD
jgi:hypothetical protein